MIVHFSKTRNEAMKRSSEGRCRKLCAGRRNNVYDAARTSLFPLLFGIDDAAWIVLRKWEVVELRALGRATRLKLDDIVCRAGWRTMRTLRLLLSLIYASGSVRRISGCRLDSAGHKVTCS
jgi:hypothetical protein